MGPVSQARLTFKREPTTQNPEQPMTQDISSAMVLKIVVKFQVEGNIHLSLASVMTY
jgi:hypothetical protein